MLINVQLYEATWTSSTWPGETFRQCTQGRVIVLGSAKGVSQIAWDLCCMCSFHQFTQAPNQYITSGPKMLRICKIYIRDLTRKNSYHFVILLLWCPVSWVHVGVFSPWFFGVLMEKLFLPLSGMRRKRSSSGAVWEASTSFKSCWCKADSPSVRPA